MSAKTIFIIAISVLLTVILMKNTDEVNFWIFGDFQLPKLAVLGVIFGLGLITGFILGKPRQRILSREYNDRVQNTFRDEDQVAEPNYLSDEDREYIS